MSFEPYTQDYEEPPMPEVTLKSRIDCLDRFIVEIDGEEIGEIFKTSYFGVWGLSGWENDHSKRSTLDGAILKLQEIYHSSLGETEAHAPQPDQVEEMPF